ncbi:RNA polymerase factor sigma-54 [Oceanobacillus sp. Castelsardo]|uniref:RNA polymerase factor sigma-54 n=1 Tax=Oceanobacillus sp. Castelsardo TaxID=1851204 RepID=UPI0008387261|nr:RNA polymerase factor sigma-54 [Oceanobacillus sp. Castelsardo]
MKTRLIQNQTLQWKMNQSLMQSIQLLQYNSVQLMDYINQIAKENPLIEEVNYDYDMVNYRRSHSYEKPDIGEINEKKDSMYEHLKKQLVTLGYSKDLQPVIEYGIDSLNEDGYLDIDLNHWAEECSTTLNVIKKAIDIIQMLEPVGIGARTLSECIILQLRKMDKAPPFLNELLNNHLDWIANEEIDLIARSYGITETVAKELIRNIRLCHPKPGQLLNEQSVEYIIPEAMIYKEDDIWKLKFYNWASPIIKVNHQYEKFKGIEKETDLFLKEKYNQVETLKQAIYFRTNTLESIIKVIIENQFLFFEYGMAKLKTLTLREIASQLEVHISTVSRTISHKYVQTPFGVLPIKFFLQSGIRKNTGENIAKAAIQNLMNQLIDGEDKCNPLSDQKIKNILEEEFGIQIARRTIMKYREQLRIPSSTNRRRKK